MTPDERIERTQWDTFWVPDDVRIIERPQLLVMCCARGDTNYNMVLRLRAHGDEERVVAELDGLHRGVKSVVPVNPQNHTPELEAALTRHGWRASSHYDAYIARVGEHRPRPHPGVSGRLVHTREEVEAFLEVNRRAFGTTLTRTEEEVQQFLRDGNGPRVRRAVAWRGDEPIAAGGITAHPAHDIAFLWGGGTVPEARHQGAYSAVMEARVAWARELGLGWVGLYARTDTSAPVVARQGFTRHGFMTFWVRPA